MATSKSKKFKVDPLSKANSDINVTPLVDVVLVLLIIFMVVTPLMEKDIQVRIPEQDTEETPPPPPDQPPPPQIVLAITEEGQYLLNNEPIAPEQITEKLKRALAAKKFEDKIVFFMPHEKSNYGLLIAALDMARAADKNATLGMVTQDIPIGAPAEGAAPPPAP